jgi:hypothetical protein
MLGVNEQIADSGALFAAESTVAQVVPLVIGAVFTIGVVVVGLLLSRSKSGGAAQAEDELAQQPQGASAPWETGQAEPQEAAIIRGRNPMWGLILPGIVALVVVGGVIVAVIPLMSDLWTARENFREAVRPPSTWTGLQPQPVVMPPVQWDPAKFQYTPPQIHIPPIQPTMPRIPQVYIDRSGVARVR